MQSLCTLRRPVKYLGAEAEEVQGLHGFCDGLVERFVPHHPSVLPHAEAVFLVGDVVVDTPSVHKLRRRAGDGGMLFFMRKVWS